MLMKQKAGHPLHPSLLLTGGPQTLVVTSEGSPLSVPTSLLVLYSSRMLASLLDLPPCVSTSIILPDTSLKTLSILIDLLKTGKSLTTNTNTNQLQILAKSLGISLGSVTVTTGEDFTVNEETSARPSSGVRIVPVPSSSPAPSFTINTRRKSVGKAAAAEQSNQSMLRNIKKEATSEVSSSDVPTATHNCEICRKHFNAAGPLAFHYCKHFYKELQNIPCPDFIEENRCNKCEKTFPDQRAMLCHIGVKHKFINQVLTDSGYSKVPLSTSETTAANIKIKMEKQSLATGVRIAAKSRTPKTKPQAKDKTGTPKRQPRNSKEIKEVRFCEICDKELENVSQLATHMIGSHFLKDIREKFSHLYNGKECLECSKSFTRNTVWMHLGSVHNKLDELLVEKGHRPIKSVVTPKMRKVVVKKERAEASSTEEQDYQLPNLFESVLTSAGQEQEPSDNDPMMIVNDPLMS